MTATEVRGWREARPLAAALAMLALLFCALRFVALEHAPPGFYADEAAGASHVLCLRDRGHDHHGQAWPLFSEVLGYGLATPVFLYSSVAWASIVGGSPGALRGLTAAWSVLAILALFVLVRRSVGPESARWVAVAAAISPWGFQFSRIYWDPALAPALLAGGLCLLLGFRGNRSARLAGLLLSLTLYSYPPTRVHVPLLLGILFLLRSHFESLSPRRIGWALLSLCVVSLPLVALTLSGELMGRAGLIALWSDDPDNPLAHASAARLALEFAWNWARHLEPGFLLASGDPNLRHSTGSLGLLSWLDVLALCLGLALAALSSRGRSGGRPDWFASDAERGLFLLGLFGWLTAFVPAALTRDGLPHALRSLCGWPLLSLATGIAITAAARRVRHVRPLAAVTAAAFAAALAFTYFGPYPDRAAVWFDPQVRAAAEEAHTSLDWERFDRVTAGTPKLAGDYYRMQYGALDTACRSPLATPAG